MCGNTGDGSNGAGDPTLYKIAINANSLGAATSATTLTSAGAACSPVSEIFTNDHDDPFLSVTANGDMTGCAGACVYNFDITSSVPGNAAAGFGSNGGSSAIVADAFQCGNLLHAPRQHACKTPTGCAVQVSQAPLN